MSLSTHPQFIDHFEILGPLGQGGMGVVYRARDIRLDREVAIKMPLAGTDAQQLQRFEDEARLMVQVQHDHILSVFAVGKHQGRPYLVMPLVSGGTLKDRLAELPTDLPRAVRLVAAAARGVAAAHAAGVIHRDLKPENIFIEARESRLPGQRDATAQTEHPLVADFGLARPVRRDDARTQGVAGSPEYMSPEQANEQPPTTAVDVYGLGAVLYACLTGRPPVQAASLVAAILEILDMEPTPPRQLNPSVDAGLEAVCLKCLCKRPEDRYGSADDLADDLENWLAGRSLAARPLAKWQSALRWSQRQPLAAGMLMLAALILITGSATFVRLAFRGELLGQREAELSRLREETDAFERESADLTRRLEEIGREQATIASETENVNRQILAIEAEIEVLSAARGSSAKP